MTSLPFTKVIDIADFADPCLTPFLEEISYDEMVRFGLSKPAIVPDSKQWECAMMLRTFAEHGVIGPNATFAGIGAGTEQTTYALAARGCVVFPTDRYLEVTPWSDVAPAGMMVRPAQYTKFKFDCGNVLPVHTDARVLRLPSNFFDGVYSAGSIEHFGSLEAVAAAAEEIGRILKPGGVAGISTEFRLEGPNDRPWFDDTCILFTPELLDKWIVKPSGLEVIGDATMSTSPATYDSRVVLLDFLSTAGSVDSLTRKRSVYPNLVLFHQGFLFCSVHLALRKPLAPAASARGSRSRAFESSVETEARRVSGVLTEQIRAWNQSFGSDRVSSDRVSSNRVRQLEADMVALLHSRSMRITRPLREFGQYARTSPMLRGPGVLSMRAVRMMRRVCKAALGR
jgi:SAM-dependent methyltransferase